MEKKFSKEDIIKNGDSDELYELRMWLFKESCRLENQESTLDDRFARLEADEKKFREEASAMKKEIALQEGKLRKDAAFFDQKLAILRKGYDDLNEDRHKLEEEKKRIEKEKDRASGPTMILDGSPRNYKSCSGPRFFVGSSSSAMRACSLPFGAWAA